MRDVETLGEIAYVKTLFDGAVAQLERIAKARGFDHIWYKPSDPTRWFAERKGQTEGTIEVAPLDELLAQ